MENSAHLFTPSFAPATFPTHHEILACIGPYLLVTPEGRLPAPEALLALGEPGARHVIGRAGEQGFELWFWPGNTPFPEGLRKGHFRTLWGHYPEALLAAANRAAQLGLWLEQHRFCSHCATALHTKSQEPARYCPACGALYYPRIAPVCMVLIQKGDEILLARSPHFQPGVYSALAGFIEAGESVEASVRREVQEEVGLEINNLRWFGSQAWPYPNSLMLGFFADYASGHIQPQPGEIEDAQWFSLAQLPTLPHPASLAAQMIASLQKA